jgi:hypothetical protein
MNRLFGVLIVLAIIVVGVGFYRGWFALSRSAPDSESNKVNINLATDPDKMKQDAQMISEKATELTDSVKNGVKAESRTKDTVKLNDP